MTTLLRGRTDLVAGVPAGKEAILPGELGEIAETSVDVLAQEAFTLLKLLHAASEYDHLGLLGLLNSSTACFWLKQACFPKGGDHQGTEGARVRTTLWDERYAFNSTQVGGLPIPCEKPLALAQELDRLADHLKAATPPAIISAMSPDISNALQEARQRHENTLRQMIALQEELDWESYRIYGLLTENFEPPHA